MIIGQPRVVSLKCLKSSGICQGIFPHFPMALFSDMAAIAINLVMLPVYFFPISLQKNKRLFYSLLFDSNHSSIVFLSFSICFLSSSRELNF